MTLIKIKGNKNMFKLLDYMEYSTDALAQVAYVTDAVLTIDQSYTPGFLVGYFSGVLYSNTYYFWSNEFVPTYTVPCPRIDVGLIKVGTPTGNFWLEIQTDDGSGKPSNSAVTNGTSATKDVTTITDTELTWYSFTFTTPPWLTGGTKYHIVVKGDYSVSTSNYIAWASHSDSGMGAERKYCNNSLVWSNQITRQQYKTYYYPLQCYSEATIKNQGIYSLKGVAIQTDSLNKTLTRIVSPTIDLSGLSQIKFDIRSSRTGSNIKIGLHDSGGTTTEIIPNIISDNTWQEVKINLQNVTNANKDVIDSIIVTIVNADVANTFYIDNLFGYYIPQIIMNG
jgi:hypothetical protein